MGRTIVWRRSLASPFTVCASPDPAAVERGDVVTVWTGSAVSPIPHPGRSPAGDPRFGLEVGERGQQRPEDAIAEYPLRVAR
jgi:hypothetical protein